MCLDFVHIAIFLLQRFTNGSIKSQNSVNSKSKLGPKKVSNLLKKHKLKLILSVWTPYIFNQYICTSIFLTQSLQDHPFLMFRITQNHIVWKSPKKSHSKLRAKRATFTFWVDKSLLKMPKKVHFGEFLKIWSLRSNNVTRLVTLNRTKIGGKYQKIQMRHFE